LLTNITICWKLAGEKPSPEKTMPKLPAHLPQTVDGAAAHIYAVTTPSADDLKVMVCLEAAGQGFYGAYAEVAPNDEVRAVFDKNGQEELGHAHRVSRALKLLYDVDFAVPEPKDNPYYAWPKDVVLSKEMIGGIAHSELAGDALYDLWATNLGHEEAGRLLRLNGREEKGHGERMLRAANML
jgi:rubrerythrin